jgi:hypothetical protein
MESITCYHKLPAAFQSDYVLAHLLHKEIASDLAELSPMAIEAIFHGLAHVLMAGRAGYTGIRIDLEKVEIDPLPQLLAAEEELVAIGVFFNLDVHQICQLIREGLI